MTTEPKSNRTLRPILLIILLGGFYLRTFRLGFQELRGDETFGYLFSLPTFSQIISRTLELQEPHPVASYFVQSIWLDWVGYSEFALRFPSTWFGQLAVVLLVGFARSIHYSPTAIVYSTILLAASPYAIWHSQDARMYSMSLTLTIASYWLFVTWLSQNANSTPFEKARREMKAFYRCEKVGYLGANPLPLLGLIYIIITWLALHTHYFTAFVVISQNIFVLFLLLFTRIMSVGAFARWLGLQASLGLAYMPWLLSVRSILVEYSGNGDSPSLLLMLERAVRTFAFGESISEIWIWLAAILLLIGVTKSLAHDRIGTSMLMLYWFIPLAFTWYSALKRPIFDERYLIAATPPFLLLIGRGMASSIDIPRHDTCYHSRKLWPARKNVLPLGLALLLTIGISASLRNYYANPQYSKSIGWRELATTITQLSEGYQPQTTRLVQNYPDPTLWYYYSGDLDHLVLPPASQDETGTLNKVEELIRTDTGAIQHIVMAVQPANNWDDSKIAQRILSDAYTLIAETTVSSWPIEVYSRPPDPMPPIDGINFVNGLIMSHASVTPLKANQGGILSIHIGWQSSDNIPLDLTGHEKIFLHLIDSENQLVAQHDAPLQMPESTDLNNALVYSHRRVDTPTVVASYGILLPIDAPLGDYRLVAGLYDPSESNAPRVLTQDENDSVLIEKLRLDSAH